MKGSEDGRGGGKRVERWRQACETKPKRGQRRVISVLRERARARETASTRKFDGMRKQEQARGWLGEKVVRREFVFTW